MNLNEDEIPMSALDACPYIDATPKVAVIERDGTISDAAADHAFMLSTNGTVVVEPE